MPVLQFQQKNPKFMLWSNVAEETAANKNFHFTK